ncbi:MAG TPA: HK97 family phage prohead protease [Ktedonobacteraceae bacterium]|nr:HK97 family phage prohead protease [Ktedonobacteraceae bacterium]
MTTAPATFPSYSIKGRQVEYKSFAFRVKSFDEAKGTITGYLSTFGNIDLQKDCVVRGAFKKTLTEAYARKANGRQYLFALLWMHDPERPIGGVIDAQEDAEGLLITAQLDISVNAAGFPSNPVATMVFSGFKSGYIDELSMGYLAIQKDYEAGIRYLKEVALLEGSAVTMLMAANPQALVPVTGVKHMLGTKAACGKTTWPLADRKLAWDNGEAHNAIVEWATQDDGSIDQAKLQSVHFWCDESAPENIASYKFLFCDVFDGEIKAVPRGIFACVGGHGLAVADIPESDVPGVQAKISAYYKRMRQEFDDDSIVPTWEESDKAARMPRFVKDFNAVHQAGKAADCLEDWCDLLDDLTQTMFQIFGMGDSPEPDMADCLKQFGAALTNEWLPKALEADLGQYLNDRGYCNDANSVWIPGSMQVGGYDYGYMARAGRASRKSGRTISAATQEKLEQHQAEMKALMDEHQNQSEQLASQFKAMVKKSMEAMNQKVSDLTDLWADEGQGPAYGNDDPPDVPNHTNDDNGKSRFVRREPTRTPTRSLPRQEEQPPRKSRDTASSITLGDLEALIV